MKITVKHMLHLVNKKWYLFCWLMIILSCTITAQDAATQEGGTDQQKAKNIFEQFFDLPQAIRAYDISKIFDDNSIKDTIETYEQKLGVDIVFLTYFDTQIDELWPNVFRKAALKERNDVTGKYVYTDLLFTYVSEDVYTVKVEVSCDAQTQGEGQFENLKTYLEENLGKRASLSLEIDPYKEDLAVSMEALLYGNNDLARCATSPIKRYLENAVNELLEENQSVYDSLSVELNMNNSVVDQTQSSDDDGSLKVIEGEELGFTENDIEKKGFPYEFKSFLKNYDPRYELYFIYEEQIESLATYTESENICDLAETLEPELDNRQGELYVLIHGDDEGQKQEWMKNYISQLLNLIE